MTDDVYASGESFTVEWTHEGDDLPDQGASVEGYPVPSRVERAIEVLHAEGDYRYDEALRAHADRDCEVCDILMSMVLDED